MIERRTIRFDHETLAQLELPCFEAAGDRDGPQLCLLGGIHGGRVLVDRGGRPLHERARHERALRTDHRRPDREHAVVQGAPCVRDAAGREEHQPLLPGLARRDVQRRPRALRLRRADRAERLPARPARRRHGRGARAVHPVRRIACLAGGEVRAGSSLGAVRNLFGDAIERVAAPEDGVVLFMTTSPAVGAGGLLLGLGVELAPVGA